MHDMALFCHSVDDSSLLLRQTYPAEDDLDDIVDDNTPDFDRCTFKSMITNLSSNAFLILGRSSDTWEVLKAFPANSLDELNEQSVELGEDFGSLLRIALDYTD